MGVLALLSAALPASPRAEKVNTPFLCIEKTDGKVMKVEIAGDYPRLAYAASDVLLLRQNGDTLIPREDIVRIYTTFEIVDAVNAAHTSAGKDTQLKVYNINGQSVSAGNDVKKLPRGVYVINNGGRTYKYVAR